jgi:hypothetical protein
MNNVIDFKTRKAAILQHREEQDVWSGPYSKKIQAMDKLELLDQMVTFQEQRSKTGLSTKMMIEGQILFKALESTAQTEELRVLARNYCEHLKEQYEKYKKCWTTTSQNIS